MRNSFLTTSAALCLTVTSVSLAGSPVDPVNKNRSGVAMKGYDPVAYFTHSKPVKGLAQFSHEWYCRLWRMRPVWWGYIRLI